MAANLACAKEKDLICLSGSVRLPKQDRTGYGSYLPYSMVKILRSSGFYFIRSSGFGLRAPPLLMELFLNNGSTCLVVLLQPV